MVRKAVGPVESVLKAFQSLPHHSLACKPFRCLGSLLSSNTAAMGLYMFF